MLQSFSLGLFGLSARESWPSADVNSSEVYVQEISLYNFEIWLRVNIFIAGDTK